MYVCYMSCRIIYLLGCNEAIEVYTESEGNTVHVARITVLAFHQTRMFVVIATKCILHVYVYTYRGE